MKPEQLTLPFRSLDFPDRRTLTVGEICGRLGLCVQHVLDLIAEGAFAGLDVSGSDARRKTWRIPVESYRDFIARRLSGGHRHELLRQLPRPVLEELHRDLARILAA
ncbi:MAG: hypothetical protein ACREIA_24515 [Opitutaceae bacterium]